MTRPAVLAAPASGPRRGTVILIVLWALILVVGFFLRVWPDLGYTLATIVGVSGCGHASHSNERNASTTLKTIAMAQFDFRSSDRDWNDIKDFWRKDIAGLYALTPGTDPTKTPIRLIELSTAAADDRPASDISPFAVASPKAGYWYRALLHEGEQGPSPDRFAACAFPDNPDVGRWTFIIDEENFVYRKALGKQRGLDRYPADPVAAGWERLD